MQKSENPPNNTSCDTVAARSLVLPSTDSSFLPLRFHVLGTALTNSYAAHSDLALPHILIAVFSALLAQNRDLHMLFDTCVGLQVRSDLQAVDDSIVGNRLQIDWMKNVAVVDALMLLELLRGFEGVGA